jgi:hypothetical protein
MALEVKTLVGSHSRNSFVEGHSFVESLKMPGMPDELPWLVSKTNTHIPYAWVSFFPPEFPNFQFQTFDESLFSLSSKASLLTKE